MWNPVKTSRAGILLSLEYERFATIEVEKKTNGRGVTFYEVRFHIEDVTDQSVNAYQIEQVSEVLGKAKEMIEDLYEDVVDLSQTEIYEWLEDFVEEINDF